MKIAVELPPSEARKWPPAFVFTDAARRRLSMLLHEASPWHQSCLTTAWCCWCQVTKAPGDGGAVEAEPVVVTIRILKERSCGELLEEVSQKVHLGPVLLHHVLRCLSLSVSQNYTLLPT